MRRFQCLRTASTASTKHISVCLCMRRVTTRQNQNLFGALSQKCWGWRCLVCAIPPCGKGFPSAALHSGWAPREAPRLSTIWQSRGYIFICKEWWWPPLEEFSLILIHTLFFPILWGPQERQVPVLDVPQSASTPPIAQLLLMCVLPTSKAVWLPKYRIPLRSLRGRVQISL